MGAGADGVSGRSEKSSLGEGDGFPVADDEVVDEAHVDERECFGEPLGDGAVGNTWLRNALRVSVRHHEGAGVVHQRAAHHDARMDGGAVHRSIEDFLVGDGPVVGVEEDRDEDLVAPPVKAGRGGSRALDAREQRFGGRRRRSGAGRIGCGGLGADGGGKRGIGRHDGFVLGSVGERPGDACSAAPDHAPAAAPLDLPDGSRHAVASPVRIPAVSLSRRG